MNPKATRTFLYYSGPADEEGNWTCKDGETVSMKEVLDLAKAADLDGHLEIESDSDFSGKLCYQAKEWMAEWEIERKEDIDNLENVIKSL